MKVLFLIFFAVFILSSLLTFLTRKWAGKSAVLYSTPLAVDQYSRFMAEMFDEKAIIGVPSVWQHFFGRPEFGSKTIYSPDAKVVEIDIMRGNERIAALINRGTTSESISTDHTSTQNYTNFVRAYPLGEQLGHINADQLLSRVAGENPYENRTRPDRMRLLAREHHLEHIRRFARMFEYLAGQSLLTGKQPGIIGTTNTDLIYDFRRNSANFITPAIPWSSASAVPETDIDNACNIIRKNAHITPNCIFMAQDVMPAFMTNTQVRSLTDKLYFGLNVMGPNEKVPDYFKPLVEGGAIPRGRIQTPAGYILWVFTYIDVYDTSTGANAPSFQNYMPLGTAFISYFGARCDRYFGPPEVLPVTASEAAWYNETFGMNMLMPMIPPNIKDAGAVIQPAMFYSSAYASKDNKKITIRTQTAPIFATTQTDAFVTLSNLIQAGS